MIPRLPIFLPITLLTFHAALFAEGWPQWGQDPQHSGSIAVVGQNPSQKLTSMIYDPFVARSRRKTAENCWHTIKRR